MARKNLLANVSAPFMPDVALPSNDATKVERADKPAPAPTITRTGAFGTIGQSLEKIASQAEHAKRIELQLNSGATVVELDPSIVDPAFIADRMGANPDEDALLKSRIKQDGQLVPILVRPHPQIAGRYQVAYGHRRLRAVASLGLPVRAVVRELTDAQLVVAQGQENSSRTDLSFLERALFALKLEESGYSRDLIMSALAVDKTALSRLISFAEKLPRDIAEAIGPAPSVGRVKWVELSDALQSEVAIERARKAIESFAFETSGSDQRFEIILDALKTKRASPTAPSVWNTPAGIPIVKISKRADRTTLVLNEKLEPDFGQFVAGKLESLYQEFKNSQKGN